MRNNIQLIAALAIALAGIAGLVMSQPDTQAQERVVTARPYEVYQSGGNCVYIVVGKYASFISVVPVGQGGC